MRQAKGAKAVARTEDWLDLERDKTVIPVRENHGTLQQRCANRGGPVEHRFSLTLLTPLAWRRFWQDLVKSGIKPCSHILTMMSTAVWTVCYLPFSLAGDSAEPVLRVCGSQEAEKGW